MALDATSQSAVLIHRFGFVPKKGGLAAVGKDARGALLAELDDPRSGQIQDQELLTSAEAMRAATDYKIEPRSARVVERAVEQLQRVAAIAAAEQARSQGGAMQSGGMQSGGMQGGSMGMGSGATKPDPTYAVGTQLYRDEVVTRYAAAFDSPSGLSERLVWFWSNHFCISAEKDPLQVIAGAYEREAIRPHIKGKFVDMLLAVESHPAMLMYLDNWPSIGPNSRMGLQQKKGLNENLAREILELHTVGVNGGYTQSDVTNFAKVLTGWTTIRPRAERGGEFTFNPDMHEPGPQRVLDREFAAPGMQQGRDILQMLARHPSTARHLAFKMVRHFVSDSPPQPLVDRLAKRYLETDGDLKEMTKTLIRSDEAAAFPRGKIRTPSEWLVSFQRAVGQPAEHAFALIDQHKMLGQPIWSPPAPKGFSDYSPDWFDGISARLDLANASSHRFAAKADARDLAEDMFGPLLSRDTRLVLARAESRQQALALFVLSPEFQRR